MSLNDWQKIDTFDERIEWQRNLALEVKEICNGIASTFGKKTGEHDFINHAGFNESGNRYEYRDEVVSIRFSWSNDGPPPVDNRSTTISLVSSSTQVFSFSSWREANYEGDSIHLFRVGSWLNHIESLRLKLETLRKAESEKAKQEMNRDRNLRFGRLD